MLLFLSPYTDAYEKRANVLLRQLSKTQNVPRGALRNLMQEDLLRLSVWMEYKYKGYKNLRKRVRKKLYLQADQLRKDFKLFLEENRERLKQKQAQLELPEAVKKAPEFVTILAAMDFLKPGEHFNYREGAALEKMLEKPKKSLPEADCNQLTTMYIALYATQHPIDELQIKLLPQHVCLYYKGVDIETTSATLAEYKAYDFLCPVEEILATNLLDVPDPKSRRFKPSAETLLQSAHLAFQLSSHRQTVEKNLKIAYHNLAVELLKEKQFKQALNFAQKAVDSKLERYVLQSEAWHYLKAKNLARAEAIFRRVNDSEGLKACLQQELNVCLEKLAACKTLADYKRHKSTLQKALDLSRKIGSVKVEEFAKKILVQI